MELHSFSARGWLENEEEEEEEEGKAAALGSFVWAVSRFCVHLRLSNKESPGQALRSNERLDLNGGGLEDQLRRCGCYEAALFRGPGSLPQVMGPTAIAAAPARATLATRVLSALRSPSSTASDSSPVAAVAADRSLLPVF